ncbi:MAG: ThiF family adenylyltransferase, partial [Planctomycetota bacterium]|nr:ThiF family adenylyltransferase [Planctomycetota bacterium]
MPETPDRYNRHHILGVIGKGGQQKLSQARVLIVGCGALGTHSAEYLARGGIGELRLVDRDFVDWSNLQRQ